MHWVRGLAHVHSTYSYDGRHPLPDLYRFATRRGYAFVAMTEHSDGLGAAAMSRFVEECRRLTTGACVMLPGVEFSCAGGFHVLGYGIDALTSAEDPEEVAGFVRSRDGVAVLAHPVRYDHAVPPRVARAVDGLEVWNAAYDGRYLPDARSLALLGCLRDANRALLGFGGEDLHRLDRSWSVTLVLGVERLTADSIVEALRLGRFTATNGLCRIDAREGSSTFEMTGYRLAGKAYRWARGLRNRVRAAAT